MFLMAATLMPGERGGLWGEDGAGAGAGARGWENITWAQEVLIRFRHNRGQHWP